MSKGDWQWEVVKGELEYHLGRVPTDKEIQLELDRLIDGAGGKITKPEKDRHKR